VSIALISSSSIRRERISRCSRRSNRARRPVHPAVMVEVQHLVEFGGSEEALFAFMTPFGYGARPMQNENSRDVLFLPAATGRA